MGEQFVDLFAAGAYAVAGRLMLGLGNGTTAWLFELLASLGLLHAVALSATGRAPDLWLRHLLAVALASLMVALPLRVDLAPLDYAAPGRIESLFGTRYGAAPHLTYAIERLGAAAATSLRGMAGSRPALAVPGVVAQVADLAASPLTLDDPQLRANLEIWRRRIVPQLLQQDPALESQLRATQLLPTLLDPVHDDARFAGARAAAQATQLHAALADSRVDLGAIVAVSDSALRSISDTAGADPWIAAAATGPVSVRFASRTPNAQPPAGIDDSPDSAFGDAVRRGSSLAAEMIALQPDADRPRDVASIDDLYRHLATSILVVAGTHYAADASRLALLGSLCQRSGEEACRAAQAALPQASALLRQPDRDAYNAPTLLTLLRQSLATLLLAVASMLVGALSSLVVAVLPFMLGIAKALAIVLSVVGVWLLLWPGRFLMAMTWIVGPVAFVGLWSVLFAVWIEIEGFLSAVASTVGGSDQGSWSAGRLMSIALSLGYLGLPTLALHILFGTAHGALAHGGHQLENALRTGIQHTPSIVATGRRWLWRSPLAQRVNRRIYAKVGLGALAARRARARTAGARTAAAAGAATGTGVPAADPAAAPSPPAAPPAAGGASAGAGPDASAAPTPAKPARRPSTRKPRTPSSEDPPPPKPRRKKKSDDGPPGAAGSATPPAT